MATVSYAKQTTLHRRLYRKSKFAPASYGILFLLVIPLWIGLAEADDAPDAMFFGLLPIWGDPVLLLAYRYKNRLLKTSA